MVRNGTWKKFGNDRVERQSTVQKRHLNLNENETETGLLEKNNLRITNPRVFHFTRYL